MFNQSHLVHTAHLHPGTFSDMNAERDALGKFVFPALQEMIYQKRVLL